MKLEKLKKNKLYLLACSYGPDSMALFALLKENNINFEVAHLNYHLRDESDFEEKSLREYSKENNIKIHVKSVFHELGNVEKWAREERYSFFDELMKNDKYEACLIAHNLDDLVETYFLQKERGIRASFYGLKEEQERNNKLYIRPLLRYRKSELEKYCIDNNVPFSVDKSNFDESYRRNMIRIEIVSKMNNDEISLVLNEIDLKNKELEEKNVYFYRFITSKNRLKIENIKDLDENEFIELFYLFLEKQEKFYKSFSKKEILDIKEKINKNDHLKIKIDDDYYIFIEYGELFINKIYSFTYNYELTKEGNDIFKFKKGKKFDEIFTKYDNILIHPVRGEEYYLYKGKKKRVSHIFTDMKLPTMYRNIYPGIYSQKGEILYLPRYMEDFDIKNASLLEFSFDDLISFN